MSTTAWVLIWVLLFVAALVFFVFIGLHLYSKVKALFQSAGTSLEAFEDFATVMEQVKQPVYETHQPLGASQQQRESWRHTRRVNIIRRKKRKGARYQKTLQRWQDMPNRASKA